MISGNKNILDVKNSVAKEKLLQQLKGLSGQDLCNYNTLA